MKRKMMIAVLFGLCLAVPALALPPDVSSLKLSQGVMEVVRDVANIFAGVCGFVGFGMTAWQMVTGNMHSLNHLLFAIAGYAVANFATTLV